MKNLLENHGFKVSKVKEFSYRKSYSALMEDKGKYFGVKPEAFQEIIQEAANDARRLSEIGDNELTLFYTVITALKKE